MEHRGVKGSHLLQAQDWIDRQLGPGTFREMTKHAGDRWGVVLPGSWYDVGIINDAMTEAARRLNATVEDVATEIARLNAEKDLTSIYRVFLKIAQPQRVLSFTPRLWRNYVNFGEARAVQNDNGHYVGQGDGLPAELVDWACGCWRGFIPTAIAMAGGRNPQGAIIKRWRDQVGKYSIQLEVKYA